MNRIVRALIESARTDEIGDGKIFILPIEKMIHIRTGDRDEGAT